MQVHAGNLACRSSKCNSVIGIENESLSDYIMDMRKNRPDQRRAALNALIQHFVPATYKREWELGQFIGAKSAAHLTQMKNGTRTIGNDMASRIEDALGLPMGAMDTGENVIDFFNPEHQGIHPLSKRALQFARMFENADEPDKNKVETYLTASMAVSGIASMPTRPQPVSENTAPTQAALLPAKKLDPQ